MNLGFIGTGHITTSVIEGIFKSKLKFKKIFISPRNKLIAKKLSKRFKKISISNNNQQLIDNSDWIFLAITPKVGKKILKTLNFKKTKKIISFISTIKIKELKKIIQNKNITRVIPLPFIGMRKGPVIICPADKKVEFFFNHLGTTVVIKNEKLSKGFWATSSFMASFYNLIFITNKWLITKGVKKKEADMYVRELFYALSADSLNKKKISLGKLVKDSQTPGGTNAYVINNLKKNKFYEIQKKALNNIFKKF